MTGAVEGRIGDLQPALPEDTRLQLQPEHRFDIAVNELLGEVFDGSVLEPLLQAAPAHAVKGVHRGDGFTHPPGKLRYDLTAGVVVDLVAVVLRGVVAGGDHDAALTAQFPHRIGERRSGHQLGIDPHMHAVGSQNPGCLLGKFPGEMAAVVGDGNAGTVMILQQHPGQTLGGFAHCEAVHPGSAGIQDAPQSGSAEFQFPAEALCQQFRISGDLRSPGCQLRTGLVRVEPASVKFHLHRPFRRSGPACLFHCLS